MILCKIKLSNPVECRFSTHETHCVGNDVIFSYFANFGGRSVIRDKRKRLAEHSRMALDVFLGSHGRVRARPIPVYHISRDSDQERRGLTAYLNGKQSIELVCDVTHLESGGSRKIAPRAGFLASSP